MIPRHYGDFKHNDQVYEEIEKPRQKRSEEDMAQEAQFLSQFFTPIDPPEEELLQLELDSEK
jgi:hypothetical protein